MHKYCYNKYKSTYYDLYIYRFRHILTFNNTECCLVLHLKR
jgi:hypothetical protein